MADHYLIFIGGTGAKCAEAFVNLAATGAIGTSEDTFSMLLVDVDNTNGNQSRAKTAANRYMACRAAFPAAGDAKGSALFGPQINMTEWHVRVTGGGSDKRTIRALGADSPEEARLMNLLYSQEEQAFDFATEGFHAIPSIGAPVMQHVMKSERGAYEKFITAALQGTRPNTRVILTGSIFGGTGACTLPVMLRHIKDRLQVAPMQENIHIGCVLMLPYFTFDAPVGEDSRQPLKVESNRFRNNTRGALYYYWKLQEELRFNSMYLLGSPVSLPMGKYAPGMKKQENPSTPIEWSAALAIQHCVTTDGDRADTPPRFYINGVRIGGLNSENKPSEIVFEKWGSLSAQPDISGPVGTMLRFAACYTEHYAPYIMKQLEKERLPEPFFTDLIAPCEDETDQQKFVILREFCERFIAWTRETFQNSAVKQSLLSEDHFLKATGGLHKRPGQLVLNQQHFRWKTIQGGMYDGTKPLPNVPPQINRGLFVHKLFRLCGGGQSVITKEAT